MQKSREKNYELIEYINDVNREYAEVLVEQNINGALDTAYVYGASNGTGSDRLSLDRFDGSTGYYLYDSRGSVTGITNEEGQIYQSYRYSVFGEITFGEPQYENEYTYNGESYNPNIRSQYLRARYYCVVTADFLTEDSYLGSITEPLTLNRYNYCVGSPLNYVDPSGFYTKAQGREAHKALQAKFLSTFPSNAQIELPVVGYPYSPTGTGKADMVLATPDGLEVYELKPYWQTHIYRKDGDAIKEHVRYNVDAFVPGWKQREGYINALRDKGYIVNEEGITFDPNGLKLPIEDAYYDYATYYTVEGQPGMIYYSLGRNTRKKDPVTLPVTVKSVEEKKRLQACKVFRPSSRVVHTVEAVSVGAVVLQIIDEILQEAEARANGFFFLPVLPELYQAPIITDEPMVS